MDFELSNEQRLLQESLRRLLADRYGFERRKRYIAEPEGFSRDLWRNYAELGLLGMPLREEHGGLGGTPVDTMLVMEEFGRVLALEPYLAGIVLCGRLLGHAPQIAVRILPDVAQGKTHIAFAHAEAQSRYDLADVATAARWDGADFVIDGEKTLVPHGGSADMLIVSARVSGGRRDENGLALFLVDAASPGIARRAYATVDGRRAAEIAFSNLRIPASGIVGEPGKAFPLIRNAADHAIAALCAEAVGAMAKLHEMTIDYLKTRQQFGVPIGDFQVLQHRAADMLIALEQARSMAMLAAMMADDPDEAARRQALSAAKVQIGRSGRLIGQQAIQLHGGIGMTMEYPAGHYFKRLTAINLEFGDADYHLKLLSQGLAA